MYQVGQKVIGYWGAGHPYSYGKIAEWNPDESMQFAIQWSDGSKFYGRASDIHYGNVQSCGIGLYFADDADDWADAWFEQEAA